MGIVLKKFRAMPDLIISSPSMRTRKTVELVVQHSSYGGDIAWEDTLYGGNFYDIASALHAIPEDVTRPMVVGHNPGIEETVSLLLSLQVRGSSNHTHVRVPTAGLVYLDVHIDRWRDLKPGTCVLRWFLVPKLVKSIIK
jgi:phosphohistidine phosphatase